MDIPEVTQRARRHALRNQWLQLTFDHRRNLARGLILVWLKVAKRGGITQGPGILFVRAARIELGEVLTGDGVRRQHQRWAGSAVHVLDHDLAAPLLRDR